jgi:broad specificity phosphatase PhoE
MTEASSPTPRLDEPATRLVLIRHGHAVNSEKRCIGHTDLALSPAGEGDIRALLRDATELRAAAVEGRVRVVSSDLARAVDSARIVAGELGCDVELDARLREMNFGEWDGRTWDDIGSTDAVRLQSWMDDWVNVPAPHGEGLRDVAARAASWLASVLDGPHGGSRTIVIVAHAGWIRPTIAQLTGHPLARMFELPVDHARATIVDVTPTGNKIVASNVGHLR